MATPSGQSSEYTTPVTDLLSYALKLSCSHRLGVQWEVSSIACITLSWWSTGSSEEHRTTSARDTNTNIMAKLAVLKGKIKLRLWLVCCLVDYLSSISFPKYFCADGMLCETFSKISCWWQCKVVSPV